MHSKRSRRNSPEYFIGNDFSEENYTVLSVFTHYSLFEFLLFIQQNLNIRFTYFKKNELIYKNQPFEWPVFYYLNENFRTSFYLVPNRSNPAVQKNNLNDLFNQSQEMICTTFLIPENDKISYFLIIKDGQFRHAELVLSDKLNQNGNISVRPLSHHINWGNILFL
jgi:hypothetical protein